MTINIILGKYRKLVIDKNGFLDKGYHYGFDNADYTKNKYLFLKHSIGREFTHTPKVGLSGDIGLFRVRMENETIKKPDKNPWIDINLKDFFALAVIRLHINYSL